MFSGILLLQETKMAETFNESDKLRGGFDKRKHSDHVRHVSVSQCYGEAIRDLLPGGDLDSLRRAQPVTEIVKCSRMSMVVFANIGLHRAGMIE